jgi:hypothetical protein
MTSRAASAVPTMAPVPNFGPEAGAAVGLPSEEVVGFGVEDGGR